MTELQTTPRAASCATLDPHRLDRLPLLLGRAVVVSMLVTLGAAIDLSAQVNIETQRPEDDQLGLSGSIELDLSRDSGNVDAVAVSIDSRTDVVRRRSRTFVLLQLDQAWEGGEQYLDEGLVHLRDVRRIDRRLIWESYAQIDFNTIRRLDLRWLAGGGIRLPLTREPGRFWYGSSLMFEHEELDLPAGAVHPLTTDVLRWSNYLTLGGKADALLWNWITYVQPRVDELGDYRILTEATIEVELSERLGWSFSIVGRYDSRPPDDVKRTDSSVASGLVVKWHPRKDEPSSPEAGVR